MDLKIGMKAPEFSLNNNAGEIKSLDSFKSKKLILYFYPKDDTPGCTKESCKFRDINSELAKLNCTVVGISADGMDSHEKFIDKFNLNFELLSDVDYEISKEYGTFFISNEFGNSINRTTFLIDEYGIILNVWENIKNPENHPDDIVDFLKTL